MLLSKAPSKSSCLFDYGLPENITDPSIMSYTATQLSYATYKFTVKAYTSAGAGKEATVSIKLDPFSK